MSGGFSPLAPGATIGILGGGQLGRMLALSAGAMGFDVRVFEPEADCPAGRVAAAHVCAPWDDEAALKAFAQACDVVTFEFENVPGASLRLLETLKPVRPGARSLELTQDRAVEKRFVIDLGLETAPFAVVDDLTDLAEALLVIGAPAILKTRTQGYDGKGQARIQPFDDPAEALATLEGRPAIVEGFVDFACEVSVVLARGGDGEIAAYAPTRNVHRDGILSTSTVPADIAEATAAAAVEAATRIAHALEHVGVLAVEFFVRDGGQILVNEIAPRVHNSGHWTQDACLASQFDNHVRAIAGWPLGDVASRHAHVCMENLLGEEALRGAVLLSGPDQALHLYGKREARAGRKMGHLVTVRGAQST
jgi:5-(carboxyamino)imidazole ribonucleotide synthase